MNNKDKDTAEEITFGTNTLEENAKIAEKLADTGFESVKDLDEEEKEYILGAVMDESADEPAEDATFYEEAELWKDRYYKLLEVINTFKRYS